MQNKATVMYVKSLEYDLSLWNNTS